VIVLEYANIAGAKLSRANFEQAKLDYTSYGGSEFFETILHGTSFVQSKLGKDTENNSYAEANFIGAYFDLHTTLPDKSKWEPSVDKELLRKFGMRRTNENNVQSSVNEYPDDDYESTRYE